MLRQMAVAVVVVVLAPWGVTLQLLVVIAVVAAAFAAQLLMKPFQTKVGVDERPRVGGESCVQGAKRDGDCFGS